MRQSRATTCESPRKGDTQCCNCKLNKTAGVARRASGSMSGSKVESTLQSAPNSCTCMGHGKARVRDSCQVGPAHDCSLKPDRTDQLPKRMLQASWPRAANFAPALRSRLLGRLTCRIRERPDLNDRVAQRASSHAWPPRTGGWTVRRHFEHVPRLVRPAITIKSKTRPVKNIRCEERPQGSAVSCYNHWHNLSADLSKIALQRHSNILRARQGP